MTLDEQRKLIYSCSKTPEGKALLEFIEGECMRKMSGTAEKIQLQAGQFNLWLSICEEIAEGKGE
jgi:hypothetical protein